MTEPVVRKVPEVSEALGDFIQKGFDRYGESCGVRLRYDEFCFTAEDGAGAVLGVVTGRAYYDEVHIADLVVAETYRRRGVGSRLVRAVEDAYRAAGYAFVTLSTFGFQAPGFYEKCGYRLEFVRENRDPRLKKYFFRKDL